MIDPHKAALYGTGAEEVSGQLRQAVEGLAASVLRVPGEDGYRIRVRHETDLRDSLRDILATEIRTPKGIVPLSELATVEKHFTRTLFTRKDLMPVVDVYGYRATTAISHLHDRITKALSGLQLPPGYQLSPLVR